MSWFEKLPDGYRTTQSLSTQTDIRAGRPIALDSGFARIDVIGRLTVAEGYFWDGPSGPTIDTPSTMRASLFHDAIYQLLREGKLDRKWRKVGDRVLSRVMIEDRHLAPGWLRWSVPIRAWVWRLGVSWFAGGAASD